MHEHARPITGRNASRCRRGFTLVEAALVVIIIAVLAAILLVAVRAAMLDARRKGEQQLLTSLQLQIAHFKETFGFVPPLVRDEAPGPITGQDEVLVRSPAELRDATLDRFSVYTLPYFLLGALPKDVDGIDGFGYTKPLAPLERSPGQWVSPFSKRGSKYEALADVTRDRNRIQRSGDADVRLLDRWNRPIRFYRWENTFFTSGARQGEVDRWGIPRDLWPRDIFNGPGNDADKAAATAARLPQLRSASYALVSLGPDGVISGDDLVEYDR